jgi:flagellin-like hook-associated protein FlgL
MARIGLTLSGIERQLLNSLAAANAQMAMSSYRMATGHKINSASDNPAAFVYLSGLQSQLSNVTATLTNVTAAGSIVSQVQSGISAIQSQLVTIRSVLLTDEDHGLTPDERAAAQAAINTAITEINNIAGASINGKALLGGAANYLFSGLNSSQVASLDVYSRAGTAPTISGSVLSTATRSTVTLSLTGVIPVEGAALTITGSRGAYVLPLVEDESVETMVYDINMYSHETGVTAVQVDADTMTLTSVDYGAAATIQVQDPDALFTIDSDTPGVNASAEINGITFSADSLLVSGNRFTFSNNGFQFDIEFQPGFEDEFDAITVEDGALSFTLTENLSNRSELAVPALFPVYLGGVSGTLDQLATGGTWSGLGDNTSQALRVVNEALGKITRLDGLVDGFYNAAITTASELMTNLQDNLTDAIDAVDEVNDEEELQIQAYYEILADNSVAGLTLLNQQRSMLSKMLLAIAGLD